MPRRGDFGKAAEELPTGCEENFTRKRRQVRGQRAKAEKSMSRHRTFALDPRPRRAGTDFQHDIRLLCSRPVTFRNNPDVAFPNLSAQT